MWSNSPNVDLLIRSGVARYLEFRCLEHTYLYQNNTLQLVSTTVTITTSVLLKSITIFENENTREKDTMLIIREFGSGSQGW